MFIARADATQYLIEQGAPAGVYDSSGTACLGLMIEKCHKLSFTRQGFPEALLLPQLFGTRPEILC